MVGVEEAGRKLAELALAPKGEADYQAIVQAAVVYGLADHVASCGKWRFPNQSWETVGQAKCGDEWLCDEVKQDAYNSGAGRGSQHA